MTARPPTPPSRAIFSALEPLVLLGLLPFTLAISECDSGDPSPTPVPIPTYTNPCKSPEYWPYSIQPSTIPLTVHYADPSELDMSLEVLAILERSWTHETQVLGFRPPLDDQGKCGTDGRFDVFVWKGKNTCFVNTVASNPDTPYDDYSSFMVIDPWGDYGGEILDSTLAHEFNHACQAADDWWDAPIVFEMTSTFIEDAVYDDDDEYMGLLADFQSRPDWSLDRNDSYRTWYMYASMLYLLYLNDRYYDGDFTFVSKMWLGMRNPPGAANNQLLNEPDFEDALDDILLDKAGISFLDSVVEFARWRWYTGTRDDGQHFEEGALFPDDAQVASQPAPVSAGSVSASKAPMVLGNAYFDVSAAPGTAEVRVTLQTSPLPGVVYVVQALPGLDGNSDGELLDPTTESWRVRLTPQGTRTLVVTVLPAGENDPDSRTDDTFPVTLQLGL